MFTGADGLESNKWDLHTCEGTDGVPRGVSDIKTVGKPAHQDEYECM